MVRPVSSILGLRGLLVTILSISQLATFGFAQSDVSSAPPANAPSSTSSAPPQIHTIQVGLADHKMKPEVTIANVGDTVEFRFYPLNHSVVRAEYEHPCIPYEMTGTNKKGFFSGFFPVDKILPSPPMYSISINDTLPIYFYCSAPGSCITWGMVGVINPQANNSIDRQRQLALDSSYMLQPGEPFPAESPLPSNLPSSVPSSSPTTPAAGGQEKETKQGLSAGAIAGIVVAGVAVLLLGALLFYFWGRNKALKDEVDRKQSTINPSTPVFPHHVPPTQQYPPQTSQYPFAGPLKYNSMPPQPGNPVYSQSPSPPPGLQFSPPQHAIGHNRGQSMEISPMLGHHNNHTRTNTAENPAPWLGSPTYGHQMESAAPAYSENAHMQQQQQQQPQQQHGPVEMDGEGRRVRGSEDGKTGGNLI